MSLPLHKRVENAETQLGISGANTFVGDKVFTGIVKFSQATPAAAGSSASDATALTKQANLVTGADGTKGVALPAAAAQVPVLIVNTSLTSTLKVYPVNGGNDSINGLAEDAAFTLAAGQSAWFVATSTTQWYVQDQTADFPGSKPYVERVAEVALTATELGGTETNTSFTFPAAGAIFLDAWLNVTDAEAGTVDVGTQGTSNDPDGILDGVSVASTGYVGQATLGALRGKFITGSDPVSVTASADLNSCAATLYIRYLELEAL